MIHPTAPDTNAIRQRLEKITPGPWKQSLTDCTTVIDANGFDIATTNGDYEKDEIDWRLMESNATFIAHAPADIAALLAEVERLTKELAEEKIQSRGSWACQREVDYWANECAKLKAALQAKEGDTP